MWTLFKQIEGPVELKKKWLDKTDTKINRVKVYIIV